MKQRLLICICLVFFVNLCPGQQSSPIRIAFGQVEEKAGLDNPWKIEKHLPRLWGEILDSLKGIQIVGKDSDAGVRLDVIIREIDLSKYHIGNPLVGGYQGYRAKIVTECSLISGIGRGAITNWTLNTEITDRQLGFTVLAKGIKHSLTFTELDTLTFDSPVFQQSLVYRALVIQGGELQKKVADFYGLDAEQGGGLGPYKVLISKNADFHINAGSAEGLVKDQTYSIYIEGAVILDESGLPLGRESVLVGSARVMLVKGNHLTWLQFLDKSVQIELGTEIFLQ